MESKLPGPSGENERNATMLTGKKAPKMNPKQVRHCHRLFKKTIGPALCQHFVNTANLTATMKSYPSSKSIKSLTLTTICDLKINIPARGFYLLLRSIEEPYSIKGITTIVEDHTGNVFPFTAHNLVSSELERHPEQVLPLGTIFMLKEPFLKSYLSGELLIQTDSPSDVIILHKYHPLYSLAKDVHWKNKISQVPFSEPTTAEDWKEEGNNSFKRKEYLSALRCYLSAVHVLQQEVNPITIVLFLNLSMTYLKLNKFESARDCAMKVLEQEPKNLKALYRAGRANYELRQYELAKQYFQRLLDVQPRHEEGVKELGRSLKRLREAAGSVCVEDLYLAVKLKPITPIECADYVGPLKVVSSFEKRRSVEATEDIEPGTLIAVSKAPIRMFVHTNSDLPDDVNSNESVLLAKLAAAVQEACQLVYNNPHTFGTALYDLPINDAFFDVIKPSPFCDEETKEEPHVDVERLRKILVTNVIAVNEEYRLVNLLNNQLSSTALFLFPSHMNHNCLANASFKTYNDVMVVHAIKHIKTGDEVTIAKIDPMRRYSVKLTQYNEREIQCDCLICKCDRGITPPLREKIEKRLVDFEQYVHINMNKIIRGEKVTGSTRKVKALIKTASSAQVPWNAALPYLILSLTTYYHDTKETLNNIWKAIFALGFNQEILDSWSAGNISVSLPDNCIFSNMIFLCISYMTGVYMRSGLLMQAQKYSRAFGFGYAIYQGGTPKMAEDFLKNGLMG